MKRRLFLCSALGLLVTSCSLQAVPYVKPFVGFENTKEEFLNALNKKIEDVSKSVNDGTGYELDSRNTWREFTSSSNVKVFNNSYYISNFTSYEDRNLLNPLPSNGADHIQFAQSKEVYIEKELNNTYKFHNTGVEKYKYYKRYNFIDEDDIEIDNYYEGNVPEDGSSCYKFVNCIDYKTLTLEILNKLALECDNTYDFREQRYKYSKSYTSETFLIKLKIDFSTKISFYLKLKNNRVTDYKIKYSNEDAYWESFVRNITIKPYNLINSYIFQATNNVPYDTMQIDVCLLLDSQLMYQYLNTRWE